MPFLVLEAAVHRHQGRAGCWHDGMVTADGKRWREAGASRECRNGKKLRAESWISPLNILPRP